MATGDRRSGGVIDGIRIDLLRLHAIWMELVFPRQLSTHDVLGRWTPNTTQGWITYRLWSAVGVAVVALLYPLALTGVALRFYSRRIDTLIAGIGIVGVIVVAAVVWGALTVVAHIQLEWSRFLAVAAAGSVATVSAGLAAAFTRVGGRGTTIVLAYPAAVTAIFLPPVVAALVTPSLEPYVLDPSYDLAVWLLDNVLFVGGINESLRATFDLENFGQGYGLPGLGYILMWLGISVPVGWLLGLMVSLADLIRPTE